MVALVLVFSFFFLLFCRFFPVIAMAEVKMVLPQADPHWEGYHKHDDKTEGDD